jgi:hypothetical protein
VGDHSRDPSLPLGYRPEVVPIPDRKTVRSVFEI